MATSLVTLRKRVGVLTRQEFFRRFGTVEATASADGDTKNLKDTTRLLQETNYWVNHNIYLPTTDKSRTITESSPSASSVGWLEPVTSTVSGDKYEIWENFTGQEANEAINEGIRSAWPYFFTVETAYLVIRSDVGVTYSLSAFSPVPKWIGQVSLEYVGAKVLGQVTTVVVITKLKDTAHTFVAADVGKEIRIYAGTSAGDRRTISAVDDANTVTVSVAFTAILSTSSKYILVDLTKADYRPTLVYSWRPSSPFSPTSLYLGSHPYGREGELLRVVYEAEFPELATETATTACPAEWIVNFAAAQLYFYRISDATAQAPAMFEAQHRALVEAANVYAKSNRFQHMDASLLDDQGVNPAYVSGQVIATSPFVARGE